MFRGSNLGSKWHECNTNNEQREKNQVLVLQKSLTAQANASKNSILSIIFSHTNTIEIGLF